MAASIDLTILHAWRFHKVFTELEELLHAQPDFAFRNFGLPWHDPVYHPSTESGMSYLRQLAEVQVFPAQVALAVPELFESPQSRGWAEIQIGAAKSRGIPILIVADEAAKIPDWLNAVATATVGWDAVAIVAKIKSLAH